MNENQHKKYIPDITICRRCCGSVFANRLHNCETSLKSRHMKFSSTPPVSGMIEDMTEAEALACGNTAEVIPEKPEYDSDSDIAFLKVCDAVNKQAEHIKTDKELKALKERYERAKKEYNAINPNALPKYAKDTEDNLNTTTAK